MSEIANHENPPTMTRREFLKELGATLVATAVLGACHMAEEDYQKEKHIKSFNEPTAAPTDEKPRQERATGLKSLYDKENMSNLEIINETANKFMAYPPQSEEREKIEIELVNQLSENSTASDILLSLQALSHINARKKALDILWQKRQTGEMSKFGFQPLSEEKINWANENGITPLTLAIAEDCVIPSLVLFKANADQFLEAIPEIERKNIIENNLLPHRIPNAGYIAKLLMTETSGWKNIGTVPAITQINTEPEWFPTAIKDLRAITSLFSDIFPYRAHLNNLPGSFRGKGSASGGAIGPQLMPNNALQYIGWYNQANREVGNMYPSPNPFDIYSGTILTNLFIASEVFARHPQISQYGTKIETYEEVIRFGYQRGKDDQIEKAFAKWNPHQEQIATIVAAGESYEENFS